MKCVGLLRVKNEARWIKRVLTSIVPVCAAIFLLDDHSEDETAALAASADPRVTVLHSPFEGIDEARDKNWLLSEAAREDPDWALVIDGDEVLQNGEQLGAQMAQTSAAYLVIPILYLWNDEQTVRTDGIYGRFRRASAFRVSSDPVCRTWRNWRSSAKLHCAGVPDAILSRRGELAHSRLLHYGYIDAELRRKKFEFYNQVDPANDEEDGYRHVIQGDPGGPGAQESLKWAGPLKLEAL